MSDKKELFVENIGKQGMRNRRVVAEKYIPEHKRLDKKPFEVPSKSDSDDEEFIKHNQNVRKLHSEQKQAPKSLLQSVRSGEITREEANLAANRVQDPTYLPRAPLSGQTEDTLWTKSLGYSYDESSNVEEEYDETIHDAEIPEEVSTRFNKSNDEILTFEEHNKRQEEFGNRFEELKRKQESEPTFDLNHIDINSYFLLYNDSIVEVGSQRDVKDTLSKILETEDASIEDFTLFKRVSLKMGIFIDEE